jgi:hypothetical protein
LYGIVVVVFGVVGVASVVVVVAVYVCVRVCMRACCVCDQLVFLLIVTRRGDLCGQYGVLSVLLFCCDVNVSFVYIHYGNDNIFFSQCPQGTYIRRYSPYAALISNGIESAFSLSVQRQDSLGLGALCCECKFYLLANMFAGKVIASDVSGQFQISFSSARVYEQMPVHASFCSIVNVIDSV